MNIVCLGDSFSKGFGVTEEENWISLLNEVADIKFINKGINGDTTGGMLSRFYRDVISENPKCVMIEGGFNDFLAECNRGVVQANMMALVHQAYHHKIMPLIIISPQGKTNEFVGNWPEFIPIEQVQEQFAAYRGWIKRFCKGFSIPYIDLNEQIHPFTYIDGIHINADGHKYVAQHVKAFIDVNFVL